jgi:regulator of sigma E protease
MACSMVWAVSRSDADGDLPPIKPLDKIIVAFAGPLFSFLLAVVCSFLVYWAGKPVSKAERECRIGFVAPDMPAKKADLQVGDRILAINGNPVKSFMAQIDSVIWEIVSSETDEIVFDIERNGVRMQKTAIAGADNLDEFKQWNAKPFWQKFYERPPMRRVGIAPVDSDYVIEKLFENGPAALAGMKPGDVLRKINGQEILSYSTIRQAVLDVMPKAIQEKIKADKIDWKREEMVISGPVVIQVEREGKPIDLTIQPRLPDKPASEVMPSLGFEKFLDNDSIEFDHPAPHIQIRDCFRSQWATLKKLLPNSNSKLGAAHMTSAVGIVNVYHKLFQIKYGWRLILVFTVMLNISLAVMNLLPFPVLDGGHITMGFMEMIRGRAPRISILEKIQAGCVLMLLGFMLWLVIKDTASLFDSSDRQKTSQSSFWPQVEPRLLCQRLRPPRILHNLEWRRRPFLTRIPRTNEIFTKPVAESEALLF